MTKENGRGDRRARPEPLSALEEYLQRAESERRIRHVVHPAGGGPAHIAEIVNQLMCEVADDRRHRRGGGERQNLPEKEETNMSGWYQYARGQWKQIDCPFPDSKETDYLKALQEWGYGTAIDEIGKEWGLMLKIYERNEEKDHNRSCEFLVDITPTGCSIYPVLIEDLPTLLQFLRNYLPIFEGDAVRVHLLAIEQAIDRAFMAWHGHPSWDACRECDRVEQRLHQKRGY